MDCQPLCDAKQPRLDVADCRCVRKGLDRFKQRLLHDILAINAGADQARAIAVQPRPQARKQAVECFLVGRLSANAM